MKILISLSSTGFDSWFQGSQIVDSHARPLVCFHGSNKVFSKFSEYRPAFITPNLAYAKQYGRVIMELYLSIKKPFDTRYDRKAVQIYNEHFIKYDLARADVKPIKLGDAIHMNHADELWSFLVENPQFGYDGIYVFEGEVSDLSHTLQSANIAIVPLHGWQIKAINNKVCSRDLDINK